MIEKLFNELQIDIQITRGKGSGRLLRSKTAKQLSAVDVEDRGLTLADTEGMFLLMGIGYSFGVFVLVSEIVGGFTNKCRKLARRVSIATIDSVRPGTSRKASSNTIYSGILDAVNGIVDHTSLKSSTSTNFSIPRVSGGNRRMSMLDSRQIEKHWNGETKCKRRHNSVDLHRFKDIPFIPSIYVEANPPPQVNLTQVEINRVPTPFVEIDLDDTFGEKVTHSSNWNILRGRKYFD